MAWTTNNITEGIDQMRVYKKMMDKLAWLEKFVLIIVSVIVTVITFANVVSRYVFQASFSWSEELVINLFILMILLGCALCARDGSLISLSLIFDHVGVKAKKVISVLIALFCSTFYVVLFKTGVDKVITEMHNHKETFSLRWPQWVFTIFLPIGAAFLLIHTIEFLVAVLHGDAACIKETEARDRISDTDKGGDN